jgi:hypothetical protein
VKVVERRHATQRQRRDLPLRPRHLSEYDSRKQ